MKKFLSISGKCLLFVIINIILYLATDKFLVIKALDKIIGDSDDFRLLYNNSINLLIVIISTCILVFLVDRKKKVKLIQLNKLGVDTITGMGLGLLYSVIIILTLKFLKYLSFGERNYKIGFHLFIYILALFIYSITIHFFSRGYIYTVIEKEKGEITAIIVTSILYMFIILRCYNMNFVTIVNVFTCGLIFSFVLSLFKSLFSVIIMDFFYSLVCLIGLGIIKVGHNYPTLYKCVLENNLTIMNGITITFINLIIIIILLLVKVSNSSSRK